jgi:hypothetical protein
MAESMSRDDNPSMSFVGRSAFGGDHWTTSGSCHFSAD